MFDLIGKMFQGTQRNGTLGGVTMGSIMLCLSGTHNLSVAFRTQGTTFQHGFAVKQTAGINVQTCIDVVQGSTNEIQRFVKIITEKVFGFNRYFLFVSDALEMRVHALHCTQGSGGFRAIDVGIAEKKLTRQVAFLDLIHIGDVHHTCLLINANIKKKENKERSIMHLI